MTQVNAVVTHKLSQKNGKARLWLEGHRLLVSGFQPGALFEVNSTQRGIELRLSSQGTHKVAKRSRVNGRIDAIIDIMNQVMLAPLEGCQTLRVSFQAGAISICAIASEMRITQRLSRLKSRVESGQPLTTVGVAAGGGVLSHAIHAGLTEAGLAVQLHAFNEIRQDLTEVAIKNNETISDSTLIVNMPLQELAYDFETLALIGEVDIVELGLPCSGASVAGRAKLKLAMPEAHPEVGHLAAGALAILARLNPSVIVFENVVPYKATASAIILRQQLADLGYDIYERTVFGPDFGDFEERSRWCMVAMTKGIPFDFAAMPLPSVTPRKLNEVFEPLSEVESRWSEMEGLKAKQVRDLAAGKNFKMQIFTGNEFSIKTLTKGIAKNRSTDPKIQHPLNPDLLRIPTAKEHGAFKGIPSQLFEGLSQTKAHELLGQSITYNAFKHVAAYIGGAIAHWTASVIGSVSQWLRAQSRNREGRRSVVAA